MALTVGNKHEHFPMQIYITMKNYLNIVIVWKATPQPIGTSYGKNTIMYEIKRYTNYSYGNGYPTAENVEIFVSA